jgi:hypothetical protein
MTKKIITSILLLIGMANFVKAQAPVTSAKYAATAHSIIMY